MKLSSYITHQKQTNSNKLTLKYLNISKLKSNLLIKKLQIFIHLFHPNYHQTPFSYLTHQEKNQLKNKKNIRKKRISNI